MKRIEATRRVLAPLVFLLQFVLLGFVMRLDPDPHHDGILYGAAVSVRNGGFPNRDAFAQYGPLVPELQGLWLRFFGPSLLGIRIQALLIFMLASIAIWHVSKNFVSDSTALILSSAWTLTIPSVLPWPTIYTTCLALASMMLLINIKNRKIQENSYFILISGGLISIGTFGRIHLIVIFILVASYFLLSRTLRRQGFFWIAGFLVMTAAILIFMFVNHALSDFISQCITWPFGRYAGPTINKSYIVGLMWYPVIAVSFIVLLIILSTRIYRKIPRLISFAVPILVFLFFFGVSRIQRTGYLSLRNPRVLLIDYGKNMMNSLDYAAAFVMFVTVLLMILRHQKFAPFQKFAVLYSLGIAFQLYPLYDVIHLWMISPIFICSLLLVYGDSTSRFSVQTSNFSILALGLGCALVMQVFAFTSIDRVKFSSVSLKGMYAPKDFAVQLDRTLLNLERQVPPKSASFDCLNGLYSGAGGKYLASSTQFVNWGPKPDLAKSGKLLFVCAVPSIDVQGFLASGYQIMFKDPLIFYGDLEPRGYWNILFSRTL